MCSLLHCPFWLVTGWEVNLIMEKSISWFKGWCWVDDMVAYMPTHPDYPGISWIQSQSPALLYEWPKLPDKRKLTLVAHKKLRLKLHMFQNIQNHQASYACITISGFIFLRDAHCLLQTERKKFLLCYSYISKREFDWISIQPIEVPDW